MVSPGDGRPHDVPSPPSSMTPDMAADADGCGSVLEWEVGLPTPAELTPLSHPLIPRALAAAFRIDVAAAGASACSDSPTSHLSFRGDEGDDEEVGAAPGGGACHGGEVRKKRRMVWTAELHRRFIEAVAQLGDKAALAQGHCGGHERRGRDPRARRQPPAEVSGLPQAHAHHQRRAAWSPGDTPDQSYDTSDRSGS